MHHEQKPLKETLQPILHVLQDLGGTFSFTDEDGNQFVLASKEAFEGQQVKSQEQQLTLPQAESVSRAIRKHIDISLQDDVLDRINRDIALAYALKQELEEEEALDDVTVSLDDDMLFTPKISENPEAAHDSRIRFEPLKGDLAPDLQD
ncbi:MAG: hypothetical protein O3A36_00880 [bacterium]|nr:hypothetical protein [bacterium]